jgi:tRNA pseudouridine55 synthase
MGRRRRGPSWDGVLVVDKPAGPTSHDVVQRVRRAAGQHRVGHTGTLDPAATGVLVCCLGRAAKLVRFLQAGEKTYAARMVLGVTTDTLDAEGEVVERRDAAHVDERMLCEALTRFQGTIRQVPPMVSAIKVDGRRRHEAARAGEEVEREARTVTVRDLVLEAFEPGEHPQATFLVTCSKGTYVRSLAHDIGQDLGVGGSLRSLRRVANGPFTEREAHDLDEIAAAGEEGRLSSLTLSPTEAVRRALPWVEIDDGDTARRLAQGGRMPAQGFDGPYAVLHDGLLLGVYVDEGDRGRPELVWTRPEELPVSRPAATPSSHEEGRGER